MMAMTTNSSISVNARRRDHRRLHMGGPFLPGRRINRSRFRESLHPWPTFPARTSWSKSPFTFSRRCYSWQLAVASTCRGFPLERKPGPMIRPQLFREPRPGAHHGRTAMKTSVWIAQGFVLLTAGLSPAWADEPRFLRKTFTYKTVGETKIQADVYRADDEKARPVVV